MVARPSGGSLNQSGTHEYLSLKPQTVYDRQLRTARHAFISTLKLAADACSRGLISSELPAWTPAVIWLRTSTSVNAVARPSAANRFRAAVTCRVSKLPYWV